MDEDLLGGFGLVSFVGSFDELAVDEGGAGADERDQVWPVDRAPAVLGGLDQLERHGQPGRARAGALGDLAAVLDGRERALDRVRPPTIECTVRATSSLSAPRCIERPWPIVVSRPGR